MGVLLCYLVTCILFTVRGSSPNRRAAARSLRPSIRTAWRTRPYSSTPFIPALCQSNAKGYLLPDFYSGCATGIPGRFSEGLLLRRVHRARDGLIRIEATISDRRAKELHLTKAGEKRLQVAHERWSEA